MYKLVSPQSLVAKRAIPEPLLFAFACCLWKTCMDQLITDDNFYKCNSIMASDLAQRCSWGEPLPVPLLHRRM